MSGPEKQFAWLWRGLKGPALHAELILCPKRKWRFDFVQLESKVVVEIEGGIWVRGRHTRGKGFISDCEKYNTATLLGYKVFRLTPELIISRHLVPIIQVAQTIIGRRAHGENVPLGFKSFKEDSQNVTAL